MNKQDKIDYIKKEIGTSSYGCKPYIDEPEEVLLIGDILHYIKKEEKRTLKEEYNSKYDWGCREKIKVLELYKYYNKSIEEQTEECIDYIYNLII